MAIWRVWRHLNSRPFDRFDDVICVICVISKSYHARCKECWFYQKKTPPPKKIQTSTKRNDEKFQKWNWTCKNEDKDEGFQACETYREGPGGAGGLVPHSCRACHLWRRCVGTERPTVRTLVQSVNKNCGQTVYPGKPWVSCLLSDSMWLNCCNGLKIHIYIYIYYIHACIYACILMWQWELLHYICFHTSSFSNDKRRVSSARMPRRARRMRLWAPNSCSSVSRHVKTGEVNALDLQFAHQNHKKSTWLTICVSDDIALLLITCTTYIISDIMIMYMIELTIFHSIFNDYSPLLNDSHDDG